MLQQCCNVTKISLATYLSGRIGNVAIQKVVKLKFLQKLEICWTHSVPIKLIIVTCSKSEELILDVKLGNIIARSTDHYADSYDGCYDYMYKWANVGFKPPNLSVINALLNTIKCWPKWNSRIPACWSHCSL